MTIVKFHIISSVICNITYEPSEWLVRGARWARQKAKILTASLIHSIWAWVYTPVRHWWKAKQWKRWTQPLSRRLSMNSIWFWMQPTLVLGSGLGWRRTSQQFLAVEYGHWQVNHRDAQPLSCGPRSLFGLPTLLCLRGATRWTNGSAEAGQWGLLLFGQEAGQPNPHINKIQTAENSRQLAFHWRTADFRFSLSSSLLQPAFWFEDQRCGPDFHYHDKVHSVSWFEWLLISTTIQAATTWLTTDSIGHPVI